MREQLSSRLTGIYKFVFPTLWLMGFSGATAMMFVARKGPAPLFGIATVAGFFLFRYVCFPLKTVVVVSDGLRIGNFREEVAAHAHVLA